MLHKYAVGEISGLQDMKRKPQYFGFTKDEILEGLGATASEVAWQYEKIHCYPTRTRRVNLGGFSEIGYSAAKMKVLTSTKEETALWNVSFRRQKRYFERRSDRTSDRTRI